MADILRISTPLVEKQPVQPNRPVADPSMPFQLGDVSRVTRPADPSEILPQHSGFVPQEEAPRILADLLRDPSVAVSLMKNIFLLQEVLTLLPAANASFTKEVEQLFQQMLVQPEGIVAELARQEQSTTLFKGELFDQLRQLVQQNADNPDLIADIGTFLKGLNAAMSQRDALDSVANNLTFLGENLKGSAKLSEAIQQLVSALRAEDAPANFPQLREQVIALLEQVESSLLFNPSMEKTLPLIIYNLSRFSDNPDFLPEALKQLLASVDGDVPKTLLETNVQNYLEQLLAGEGADGKLPALLDKGVGAALFEALGEAGKRARGAEDDSQVMRTLAQVIGREADSEELQLLSGDKLEKIVQSLLSSPSNFTPLLHFIVPVLYEDVRAFAEIWIDPNDESEAGKDGKRGAMGTHMMLVFDVEGIGRFESELVVQGKRISMALLCPPPYLEAFGRIGSSIRSAVSKLGYSFETIHVDELTAAHSLIEVFPGLAHRRTGIDVKI